LAPLPVTLLPLPEAALRQLQWLGVRTLGQFAALPAAGVWQRFGQAGKLAQRLAQGQDNRPVLMTVRSAPEMVAVEVDPPGGEVKRVVAVLMAAMCPVLKRLEQELAGCRRLRLRLQFVGGAERMSRHRFHRTDQPGSASARRHHRASERAHLAKQHGANRVLLLGDRRAACRPVDAFPRHRIRCIADRSCAQAGKALWSAFFPRRTRQCQPSGGRAPRPAVGNRMKAARQS
jgi:hypothetical protein